MLRRTFCKYISAGLTSLGIHSTSFAGKGKRKAKPNFIIIFTDDQGYGDLGCFGSADMHTPNIDRMAAQGMKMTDFYSASPVCTPSRAALLTGNYPLRAGNLPVLWPFHKIGLNPSETTIADVLKGQQYATACIGKWHLGHHKEFSPVRQGFDYFYGMPYSNDMFPKPLLRNDEIIERPVNQNTLTRRYTQEAVKFIRRNKDNPFFLYLPHTMPHVPLAVSDRFRGKTSRGLYADVIAELDWSTGQILSTLKELDLEKDTLVIYTSDNGPWLGKGAKGGSAGPLRGGKFSAYEGGMRVPCVMQWRGIIPAGRSCPALTTTMDLLPTCAALAGASLPDNPIDGKNIVDVIVGNRSRHSPYDAFIYYGPRGTVRAVRSGSWKLFLKKNELYNLREDIGEQTNLYPKHMAMVKKLRKMAIEIDKEIRSQRRPPGKLKVLRNQEQ
ncbi:MAG: sulfatase [Chitinivibrionales bacterium]